jgi:hypothetical protein
MLPEDFLHMINNQLAVVMGKAELLGLRVENRHAKETCREIKIAASKINKLVYEYVDQKSAGRNKVKAAS